MGCGPSKDLETAMNGRIELAQNKKKNEESQKIHLMILGTGDSGKTTLRKQIMNIHADNFGTEVARIRYASHILGNLMDGVLDVLNCMDSKEYEDIKLMLRSERAAGNACLSEKVANVMKSLIQSPDFNRTIEEKNQAEIQLQDCWYTFAEELKAYPAWGGDGWVPSVEDCVRARARTSGIITESVVIEDLPFVLYDVGGQRSERRKWMHMFENCMACMYVVAMSEYDQVLFEDRSKNRLQESFELFQECANSAWLKNATLLLFLNKKDIFLRKFVQEKIPLNVTGLFPTAPTSNSLEAAVDWFVEQFQKRILRKTKLFVHVTTATDASNVAAVVKVVKSTIVQRNLQASGF